MSFLQVYCSQQNKDIKFENFKIEFTATKTPENLWPEIRETAKIYAIFRPSSMMCKNLGRVLHNGAKLFENKVFLQKRFHEIFSGFTF